eukprot:CAMPEP_0185837704 /NCGR_PEP_ID=MMETSP1353-20130828/11852_1 /TAXON_ID=1077150 /ORGANISM="Erythrolobus australicus, Strain CCMP3124" /LENGTH=37 /DNA_ID= /DNA_START= /DNA_END= /DNA_ORIENTATION=
MRTYRGSKMHNESTSPGKTTRRSTNNGSVMRSPADDA